MATRRARVASASPAEGPVADAGAVRMCLEVNIPAVCRQGSHEGDSEGAAFTRRQEDRTMRSEPQGLRTGRVY